MKDFIVDKELCIKCGLCAKDCPQGALEMDEFPVLDEELCFECSHCLAVCPTGALSILGKSPNDSTLLEKNTPTADQMETLIKGRRSVRYYRDENVAPETIQTLLNIASHAPTGVNMRSVLFTVIDNKETMDAFREDVYAQLAKVLPEEVPENDIALEYLSFAVKKREENGSDVIFRRAPHVVITSSPLATTCPEADTHIALAYFELMAQSMGLGTLWDGIAKMMFTALPNLIYDLGIPKDHLFGYVMAFGKPGVQYQRTVERGSARVNKVRWKHTAR